MTRLTPNSFHAPSSALTLLLVTIVVGTTAAVPAIEPPIDMLPTGAMARFGNSQFRHPGPIHSSVMSADGARLATLSTRVLQVLDLKTGRPTFKVRLTDPVDFGIPDLTFS